MSLAYSVEEDWHDAFVLAVFDEMGQDEHHHDRRAVEDCKIEAGCSKRDEFGHCDESWPRQEARDPYCIVVEFASKQVAELPLLRQYRRPMREEEEHAEGDRH